LTGKWKALDAGIGAGVDSYYEYLVKGAILFQIPQLMTQFHGIKHTDFFLFITLFLCHLFICYLSDKVAFSDVIVVEIYDSFSWSKIYGTF